MSVFDDERDDNKVDTRVKNPKRVFSAKHAHKKWGGSYKMGNRDRKESKMEQLCNSFKKLTEAEVEDKNRVNLYANLEFESTTGGIEIQFEEDNFKYLNIAMTTSENAGNGYYTLSDQQADQQKAEAIFDNLVTDIKTLMTNFDRDLQEVYRKNGLVKVMDK